MKRKVRLSILVILLIATCVYAAWESGLLLQGLKSIIAGQLSKMMQAKVSIERMDIYGNFAVVRGIDIKHRDYNFSSAELILEYDLGKILARRFDFIGGIRRITVISPKISFREMEWVEIKPLIPPSWAEFVKMASQIQSTSFCLTKGRWELGLMSIDNLYFSADLSGKENGYTPAKIAMRGIFSAGQIEIPLNFKSEIKVGSRDIRLKGNVSVGDLPYTANGLIKGSIFDPENPKVLLDLTLNSRKLKFKDIFLVSPRFVASMKGELGCFRTEGKFDAEKGRMYGQEVTGLSFAFRDDTGSFEVHGSADFAEGRLRLNRSIYKKDKKPYFEGSASVMFKDYEIPFSFFYREENIEMRKIALEKESEILLDGAGVGKLTKRRLSLSLKFEKGKYAEDSCVGGVSLGLDFPFMESLEKKLNISFGTGSKFDVSFKMAKGEVPLKLKAMLENLSVKDREISGDVDFKGRIKFKKAFLLDGEIAINSLFLTSPSSSTSSSREPTFGRVPTSGPPAFLRKQEGGPTFGTSRVPTVGKTGKPGKKESQAITNSIVQIKYTGEEIFLYPKLIQGREARGEVRLQKDKCFLNVFYFFDPPISIQGEITYSAKDLDFSGLKINNIEVNGNVNLQDRSLNLSVHINNESPLLFTNLASIFVSGLKDFKPEEGASVQGLIQITGAIDTPCIQGNVEYTGKVINFAKIEGLKYEGETLVFNLAMRWGESSLSADVSAIFDKENIDVGLNGGLNLIVGKKENPAISASAPFYLTGKIQGIDSSPQFVCEFGFRDPMINKKLGRSVKTNLKYSEGILEFFPIVSQLDYYPVGKVIFGEKLIKIADLSVYRGKIQSLLLNGQFVPDEQNIDLRIKFNEEMGNLAVFFPQDINRASGQILADLHILGELRDPVITGDFNIAGGEIAFAGTKEILKDINASLNFDTGVIKVNAKTGMGRTTLFLSGNMDYKKWVPTNLNLHLNNDFPRPLRVNIERFVDGEIALSLDITGEASSPTVKGIINVMNMGFTNWPTGGGGGLEFLAQVKWDVDMVFKGNNRYYNDFMEAEVARDSRFNFKWDGNYLFVKGRGEAERGNFLYMGREFTVMKGSSYTVDTSLESGKPEMHAYIDAKGTAKVDSTKLVLIFSGEMGKIEPVLTSEPPLSKEKMMVLLNPDYANLTSQQIDRLLGEQAKGMFAGALDSSITKPLEKMVKSALRETALRVDVFRLRSDMVKKIIESTPNTELTPLSALEGSSVEVGKYFGEKLYVDYKAILQKEKITSEWRVASEWGVEYAFVRDVKAKYAYRPKEDPSKTEHELFFEMSLRF